jgi:hypothetical protein
MPVYELEILEEGAGLFAASTPHRRASDTTSATPLNTRAHAAREAL